MRPMRKEEREAVVAILLSGAWNAMVDEVVGCVVEAGNEPAARIDLK
jgi:hypothetical protein